MNLIVAVDRNWAIGKDNHLLVSIPEDMKFFVSKTVGNVVVMGRNTLESFPGGRPLKNRVNIVMSSNPDYIVDGAVVVHGDEELERELEQYADDEIFVIGGESIYKHLLSRCDRAYVTKIDSEYAADAFFPNLDESDDWECIYESGRNEHMGTNYVFTTYERRV